MQKLGRRQRKKLRDKKHRESKKRKLIVRGTNLPSKYIGKLVN